MQTNNDPAPLRVSGHRRASDLIAYVTMMVATVALFTLVRTIGEGLSAPTLVAADAVPVTVGAAPDALWHLLIALSVVIVTGQVLAALMSHIRQPAVIGELIAGLLLGPSLLGAIAPDAYHFLLPPTLIPLLGVVVQLGVVFYMFLVGLELNPELMQTKLRATVGISHASIAAPFLLGSALALYLYPRFSTASVSFTSFALFTGVAMSITAFPVLARILADLRLTKTELGSIALTCAAVDDVTAWCLLAFIAGVVRVDGASAASVVALSVAFALLMFGVVRPLLRAWRRRVRDADPTRAQVALMIVGVLAAAATTEAIGVHALFGAFLFGAIVPRDGPLMRALAGSLEGMVTIVLLPAFFALAGMRTEIGLLSDVQAWLACGLVVIVATAGKVGATFVAARLGNLRPRSAAALGVLMNTRGLMQLIALNMGLDLGVVTPTVFTMMVVMAVITTVATPPILRRLINVPASTPGELLSASRHA